MNLLLMWLAQVKGVGGEGEGPTGPPTDVGRELYSGSKIRIVWTAGDPDAYSRIYQIIVGGDPVNLDEVAPGVEEYETDMTSGTFGVSHYRNGQETEVVSEA